MKKAYKIISIAMIAIMLVCTLSTTLYADVALTPSQISTSSTDADSTIQTIGGKILSAITTAGIVISVVMIAVLGIKYMMGSAEEKSEYKKSMMPYLIGAVLLFAASTIATAVYNLAKF